MPPEDARRGRIFLRLPGPSPNTGQMRDLRPLIGMGLLALMAPGGLNGQEERDVVLDGKTVEWLVETAVLAAPAPLREGAEVRGWTAGDRLVTLREGSNGLICLADRPGDGQLGVACYHVGLEPFMQRGRQLRRDGLEGMERQEARWAEVEAGSIPMPAAGMVYNLGHGSEDIDPSTFDPSTATRLHAVYIPGATTESTGITTAAGDGPWLMFAGTPSAHIMISIPPRAAGDEGGS